MKIMQINVVYKKGSTGKIVYDVHNQLVNKGVKSVVCYGRGRRLNEEYIHKISLEIIMKMQSLRSKMTGFAFSGCFLSTSALIKLIKTEKPTIVHLHNLNGYYVNIYRLLNFLKKNSIPTVLSLHAEFMYTGGCGNSLECSKWRTGCGNCPQKGLGLPSSKIYDQSATQWRLMKNSFEGFDDIIITTVSDWLTSRAKQAPILSGKKIITVENGLDTTVFKPQDFSEIALKHSIMNEKIILHVTPDFTNPFKGGNHVIAIANRLLDENIKVIIVGFNGDQTNLPTNVIPVKHTQDQLELAKYYSMADITILTSKTETFSMVCAESLSCGTPVVGYKAGGPESIALLEFSEFVEQGNVDKLEDTVRKWLCLEKEKISTKISQLAFSTYSKERMYEKYYRLYERIEK